MKRYLRVEVVKEMVTDVYLEFENDGEDPTKQRFLVTQAAHRAAKESPDYFWEDVEGFTVSTVNEVPAEEAKQYKVFKVENKVSA